MIIDYCDKTINLKIVYFGPALSGKTTSIKSLFSFFGKEDQIESIESTVNRTLFFDYGTAIFQEKEWALKIHIYTTTGQDFYCVTRPVTLRAVDGIIFVADSDMEEYERNLISWNELKSKCSLGEIKDDRSFFGWTFLKARTPSSYDFMLFMNRKYKKGQGKKSN